MKQTDTLTALEAVKQADPPVRLNYLYSVLREGLVKAEHVDGEWRIDRASFDVWNENRRGKGRK